jgi:pimeloyl-ACP methyl ester carboxylesterase
MELLGSANEQREVVFVDLRGTGGSNKLICPQPTDPALQIEALQSCMTDLDSDPRAYTTAWAMDDVDDVRAALGYDQINLYGGSYGATAAQIYILRHGEHVRTAVVDGATLLEVPIFERWPITSQKALEIMFARCESDAACHSAFPNLRQEFAEILTRLNRAPVTLPINNPATGQPFVLTAEVFRTSVHGALASTPTAVFVPKFIHLVYTEDWNELAAFLAPFLNSDSAAPQWKIMNLTILCYEDWAKIRPAKTTEASAESYLKYSDVRALTVPENICAAMPRPRPEALYGPLMNSSVPILFFNGEADPQDPPENVAAAKQRYPNSLSLVAPGQAHGFTGIPCRASIVAGFIEHGSVDGSSTQCLEQVALPAFVK